MSNQVNRKHTPVDVLSTKQDALRHSAEEEDHHTKKKKREGRFQMKKDHRSCYASKSWSAVSCPDDHFHIEMDGGTVLVMELVGGCIARIEWKPFF